MKLSKHLFWGMTAENDQANIRKALKQQKYFKDLYVICLPEQEGNVLDVYASMQLKQPYYKKSNQMIIGVALGQEEALVVVTEIIRSVYGQEGNFDIDAYINKYL